MTGFPSILSSGQATVVRQPNQRFQQYLLVCPNTVIFQTQPAALVDGALPYAEFNWSGTDQGDYTDVQPGMTVFFSTSSDYKATGFFRGRVRSDPSAPNGIDATTIYVNETSANLAVTDYVTVVEDYDIHERLERRTATNVAYKDWNQAFQRLPPTISGLQSVYADFSGAATVTFSFAPTVTAHASGATISSYLWDVADGTASPNLTTKDISVEFPGAATNEQRWVRLTATDSLGNSQYFVFEVYTVDRHAASPTTVLLTSDQVQISASIDEGYNATIRAWDGVSAILDQTRVSIASIDDYNGCKALAFTSGGVIAITVGDTITGATSAATAVVVAIDLDSGSWAGGDAAGTLWVNQQSGTFEAENLNVSAMLNLATIAADSINTPMTTNIAFVGRLRNENNRITGDTRHAVLTDTAFTIEGFKTQLGHINGPGTPITYAAAATAWNQIQDMTIGRIVIFALTWHSTFLNVSGLTLPSDIHDYEWREAYNLQPSPLNAWIMDIIDDINAWLTFASDGESTIQRHASYAGVSGLDTILTLQTDDAGGNSDFDEWSLELDYVPTNAQSITGAATYDTTFNRSRVYRAQSPSQVFGPGWGTAALNQQIMKSDLTVTQARTETGSRGSAHLEFTNPHERVSGTLKDGLYWITPAVHQLYILTIAANTTLRSRAYTSADKWVCTEVGYSYDPTTGRYIPQHTFEIVTTGGNYGITVTDVVDVNDLGLPDLPPIGAGVQPFDPISNYPIDDPPYELPGVGGGSVQPGNSGAPEIGCDQFNVSMKNGASVTTHNTSVFGSVYYIVIEGDGVVGSAAAAWTHTFQFDTPSGSDPDTTYGDGGFAVQLGRGVYSAGVGFVADAGNIAGEYAVHIRKDVGTDWNITSVVTTYDYTKGEITGLAGDWVNLRFGGAIIQSDSPADGTNKTLTWTGDLTDDQLGISVTTGYDIATPPPSPTGAATIKKMVISGTGINPFASTPSTRGDAFYHSYETGGAAIPYGGNYGLRIEGSVPTVPPYSSSHVYELAYTGTGNVLGFDFEDGDLTDNGNDKLRVTICGDHMALSQL